MTWGEASRLARILAADPSSYVAASMLEWDHPATREDLVLRDLHDLTQAAALAGSKHKPKLYPRPWKQTDGRVATRPSRRLTQAQIVEALRKAGHTAPLPTRAEVT